MGLSQPLVVLDLSEGAPSDALVSAWGESSFLERLAALGEVVAYGAPFAELTFARTPAELSRLIVDRSADALLLIEPEQVFLDNRLVAEGLATFDPAFHDQFTQWEHCRLPVGVGVRALATRVWSELQPASPNEAFSRVRETPAGRKFAYDVAHQVSYEESLTDARWSPALVAQLESRAPTSWDLPGFRAVLEQAPTGSLRYTPTEAAPRVDERRMPAAYGFESPECASFPTYVMFDITNVCNAACIHCPQSIRAEDGGLPEFLIKREHQTLEAFQAVVDEAAEHGVNFVRITADGEPLVHPDLFAMIEYARDKGVGPVGLTTNGSLVKESAAWRLLGSGLAMIDFSLDAITEETFSKIRVGLRYAKVQENVNRFLAMRDEQGVDLKVMVSFVKQEANADEVEAFREYWTPRVDEVVIREMISNVGLNTPSNHLWPGWDARWPCAHFFRRVVINHRGELKACPIDWEQRTVNRPIAERGVFEQWHGDFYWRHRMQHLNDAIEDSSACKTCPDWAGTPWELGYEKIVARLANAQEATA